MTFLIDHTVFPTAKENMIYDEHLLKRLSELPIFRVYLWPKIAITCPHNKQLPSQLSHYDHAPRVTGGGIVFHSPQDIVFSAAASLKEKSLPKKFKDKINYFSSKISESLQSIDIDTTRQTQANGDSNRLFCLGYPNPYELYYKTNKIVGLSLRRYRHLFLLQGVLHCQSNFDYFKLPDPDFQPYLTKGLSGHYSPKKIVDQLTSAFGH